MLRVSVLLFALVMAACSAPSEVNDNANAGGSTGGAAGSSSSSGASNVSGASGAMVQTVIAGNGGSSGSGSPTGGAGALDAGRVAASDGGTSTGGGGAGSGANDAGAVSALYNPCPMKGTPCAVMPVGDSITQGLCGWTGYRGSLFHLANHDGKLLTYVGSLIDGPDTVDDKPFPKQHEGHSGFTIDGGGGRDGIKGIITGVMTKYKPNIVLLMIGTNDVDLSVDNAPESPGLTSRHDSRPRPERAARRGANRPQTDDVANVRVRAYNAAIPGLVQTRAAAGKHIAMVDMYSAFVQNPNFKNDLMCDRLHPKGPAYEIMASTWYAAIGPSLK